MKTFNYYRYEKKHLKCTTYYVLLAISLFFFFLEAAVNASAATRASDALRTALGSENAAEEFALKHLPVRAVLHDYDFHTEQRTLLHQGAGTGGSSHFQVPLCACRHQKNIPRKSTSAPARRKYIFYRWIDHLLFRRRHYPGRCSAASAASAAVRLCSHFLYRGCHRTAADRLATQQTHCIKNNSSTS